MVTCQAVRTRWVGQDLVSGTRVLCGTPWHLSRTSPHLPKYSWGIGVWEGTIYTT